MTEYFVAWCLIHIKKFNQLKALTSASGPPLGFYETFVSFLDISSVLHIYVVLTSRQTALLPFVRIFLKSMYCLAKLMYIYRYSSWYVT
jgi:hypothetical protein